MNKCLKFVHKMEAVIASCMVMCEGMWKPAKQSRSPFSVFYRSHHHALCCSVPLQLPARNTSFQETPTHIFVPSGHLFTYQVSCVVLPVTPIFSIRS